MEEKPQVTAFQTPARILIPKLVRSRDGWKAKASERKLQCKSLQIRVRDLTTSRDRHRHHAGVLQHENETTTLQLAHTQQELSLTQQQLLQVQQERDLLLARLNGVGNAIHSSSVAARPADSLPKKRLI